MFAEWKEICVDDETFSLKELKLVLLQGVRLKYNIIIKEVIY